MVQLQEISQAPKLSLANPASSEPSNQSTTQRPWGSFTVLEEGIGYKIKRIEVKPGHRLSLQMHYHRSEHWIVVSGTAKVTCGENISILSSNQSTYVPQCTAHRLENPGSINLVIIEIQNGEYLGEDDIIRFQDDYKRK
ncbi:MAG: phosphomannose isomerase type II C-terminal cupin domain [Cyanobacteria bacterium P01_E01_bin.42]